MTDSSTFCQSLLRGAGQVMFMGNINTGALFLAGIIIGSWMSGTIVVATGAMAGLFAATAAAFFLRKGDNEKEQGLCGYNGILIGCALPTFFGSTPLMWGSLICLSAISPWLRDLMNRWLKGIGINALTFPFILLTWSAFCLTLPPAVPTPATHEMSILTLAEALLNGVSQVFLVNSYVCGILFLIGILIADYRAAAWCTFGSAVGIILAFAFCQEPSAIVNGLYGFNPALTAIALGAVYRKSAAITVVGTIATFFVQIGLSYLLSPVGIPGLTAPFCIATWILLTATRADKRNRLS